MSPQPVAVLPQRELMTPVATSGGEDVNCLMMTSPSEHSFPNNKGLLNAPGQNNCFLNSAVQVQSTILISIELTPN